MIRDIGKIFRELIILIFLTYNITSSQPQFLKTYSYMSVGNSMIQNVDSCYTVFGYTSANQAALLKADRNGDTLWTKYFGSEYEYPTWTHTIKQAADGGYYLGYRNTLIKTDGNGNKIWDYITSVGYVMEIENTFDSCVVITGMLNQKPGDTLNYIYLSKINYTGNFLWLKNYSPPELSLPVIKDIQLTSDSGFVILIDDWFTEDFFRFVKTDMNGDIIWTKKIEGYHSQGNSITETNDSSYFLTASWTEHPCEYCELYIHTWTLKLDQNGDTIWTKKYIFDFNDQSTVGKQTKDGGYIIAGYKYSIEAKKHLFVAKLTELGDTVWTKTLIDDNFDSSEGYDIIETYDGGYAVTGSVSYLNGQSDMLLLKLDKDGNITSVNDNKSNSLPKEFSLQQNYPNPFNPVTNIEYQLPVDAKVTLKVYDILGSEIAALVNEQKEAGYYKLSFDGTHLASSIYFFRLSANDFVQIKKMILMK